MAWIRLDDDYVYHPKFTALSHAAFRLWHEGMAYCRKLLTDGLIPTAALKTFRYATKGTIAELTRPVHDGSAPLWETIDRFGFKVHDYLIWNRSKEQELKDREDGKARTAKHRSSRVTQSVTSAVTLAATNAVRPNTEKEEGSLQERESEGKPVVIGAVRPLAPFPETEIASRAGLFLEKYAELFYQHRRGARYHARPHLDFPKACDLVKTWPDDSRLAKLAEIVLTTDDEWIARTDRGFAVFAARATWADDRLREWELTNGVSA